MNALYILTEPQYFSHHNNVGGHIAHAYGVTHALNTAGYSLDILSDENDGIFESHQNKVHLVLAGKRSLIARQYWNMKFLDSIKRLSTQNNYDFCYARYSAAFTPYMPFLKRVLKDVPVVLEVNSIGSQSHPWMRLIDWWGLSSADIIVCVSESLREIILNKLHASLEEKILVLPNGVNLERFEKIHDSPALETNREIKIGYTGILKPDYGLETLIRSFIKLHTNGRRISLHFYGDGPIKKVLQEQTKDFTGIIFHRPVPFDEIPMILKNLDILVYTTSRKNRFQSPIKLLEYMAACKPIVAALTPQVNMLLEENKNGLTYRIGDPDDLTEKITMILSKPEQARIMAERAWHQVGKHHTWKNRVELLLQELKTRRLIS